MVKQHSARNEKKPIQNDFSDKGEKLQIDGLDTSEGLSADWAILLKNGFTYLGDWQCTEEGGLVLERPAPKEPGVYALVRGDEVVYIGKTERTLHVRMADYRRGHISQSTSARIKALVISAIQQEHTVRVLTATPLDTEWNGLPVITYLGLEAGLIKLVRPKWNDKGKAKA